MRSGYWGQWTICNNLQNAPTSTVQDGRDMDNDQIARTGSQNPAPRRKLHMIAATELALETAGVFKPQGRG